MAQKDEMKQNDSETSANLLETVSILQPSSCSQIKKIIHNNKMKFLLESIFDYLQIPVSDAHFYTTQLLLLGYDDPNSIADIDPIECKDFMKPGHRKRFAQYLGEISSKDNVGMAGNDRHVHKAKKDGALGPSFTQKQSHKESLRLNLTASPIEQNLFLLSNSVFSSSANVILKQIGNGNSARVYQSIFLPTLTLLAMKMVFTGSMKLATRLVDAELKVLNRLSKHSLTKKSLSSDFAQFEEDDGILKLLSDDESEFCTDEIDHNDCTGFEGSGRVQVHCEDDDEKRTALFCVNDLALDRQQSTTAKFNRELVGHQSDYIIKFYDSYYDRSRKGVCLVMEYMSRGSLADLMKKGVIFSESMVAVVAYSILMALVDLHSLNMVHRDIKPENILCSADGRIKLADFGITGELMSASDRKMTFTGTVVYMSPERIKGEPHSFPCDVWGLGLSLLTLVRGSPPFAMHSFWGLVDEICRVNFLDSSDLASTSPELMSFLRAALHIEADQRSSAAELLQHPFIRNAISGGLISPPEPPRLHDLVCEDVARGKDLWNMVAQISKWRLDQLDIDQDSSSCPSPISTGSVCQVSTGSSKSNKCRSSNNNLPPMKLSVDEIMSVWDRASLLKLAQDFRIDADKLVELISKSVNDGITQKVNVLNMTPSTHWLCARHLACRAIGTTPEMARRLRTQMLISQPALSGQYPEVLAIPLLLEQSDSSEEKSQQSDDSRSYYCDTPPPLKFWDNLDDDATPLSNHVIADAEYETPCVVTPDGPLNKLLSLEWEKELCNMEPLKIFDDQHGSHSTEVGDSKDNGQDDDPQQQEEEKLHWDEHWSSLSPRCRAAAGLQIVTEPCGQALKFNSGINSLDDSDAEQQQQPGGARNIMNSAGSFSVGEEEGFSSHMDTPVNIASGAHVASSDTRDRRGGESPCLSSRPSHLGSSTRIKTRYIQPMHETCKLLLPYWTYRSPTLRGHSRLLKRVKSGTGLAECVDEDQCSFYEDLFQPMSPEQSHPATELPAQLLMLPPPVLAIPASEECPRTAAPVDVHEESLIGRKLMWDDKAPEMESKRTPSPHPPHGPSYLIPHEVRIDDSPTAVPSHLLPTSQPPRNALPPASVLAFIFSPQEIGRGGTFPGYARIGDDSTEPKDLKQPSARTARVTDSPRSTRSNIPSYARSVVSSLSSSLSSPSLLQVPMISGPNSAGHSVNFATDASKGSEKRGTGVGYYVPMESEQWPTLAISCFNKIASWPGGFDNTSLKPHADEDGEQDIRVDCLHKTQPCSSTARVSPLTYSATNDAEFYDDGIGGVDKTSSGDETVDGLDTLVLQSPAGVGVKEMLERCSSLRYLGLDDDRVSSSLSMDTLSSQSPPADATKEAEMAACNQSRFQSRASITLNNAATLPPHGSFILITGEPLVNSDGFDGVSHAAKEAPGDDNYDGITF